MLFNELGFVLVFLPTTFCAFWLSSGVRRLYVLLIASLIFYALSGFKPFIFLILSIIWIFLTTMVVPKKNRVVAICITVSFPLLVLFLFRYLEFTLTTLHIPDDQQRYFSFFLDVLLPAGISFYTLQIISYGIDAIEGKTPIEKRWLYLATYVSFFPQLIAGPILRYEQIKTQLQRILTARFLDVNFSKAFKFIVAGLIAKVFFADRLFMQAVGFTVDTNKSALDAVYVLFSYSFRIYYDFWAYSTIAIGLAALFSIDLPRNFKEPYLSCNPKEFWRKWHITLSYWLRDYVYIKMGGKYSYSKNILIVFAACGFWHGAGWNFIAWGIYHAAWIIIYKHTKDYWDQLFTPLQIFLTFTIISFGWPLFFLNIEGYLMFLTQIYEGTWNVDNRFIPRQWLELFVVAGWTFLFREKRWLDSKESLFFNSPFVHAACFFTVLLFFYWTTTFIYFQF